MNAEDIPIGVNTLPQDVQDAIINLVESIDKSYKFKNGKTALIWHLFSVFSQHLGTK